MVRCVISVASVSQALPLLGSCRGDVRGRVTAGWFVSVPWEYSTGIYYRHFIKGAWYPFPDTVATSKLSQHIKHTTVATSSSSFESGGIAAAAAVAASATTTIQKMAVVPYTAYGAPEGKGCEEASLASSAPYMAHCNPDALVTTPWGRELMPTCTRRSSRPSPCCRRAASAIEPVQTQ